MSPEPHARLIVRRPFAEMMSVWEGAMRRAVSTETVVDWIGARPAAHPRACMFYWTPARNDPWLWDRCALRPPASGENCGKRRRKDGRRGWIMNVLLVVEAAAVHNARHSIMLLVRHGRSRCQSRWSITSS